MHKVALIPTNLLVLNTREYHYENNHKCIYVITQSDLAWVKTAKDKKKQEF